jgi:hypothetical protein
VLVLAAITLPLGHAATATLWTGPTTSFAKSAATPSDVIIAGKVVLTRGGRDVLYNTAAGETSAGQNSPADTEWAFGALTNYSKLSYQSLESLRNGNLAARILNAPMVMHLVNEDVYLSVKFTQWARHLSGGGFAYTRSTPALSVSPPTVSITSPAAGATFAAPASVGLTAAATASGGSVTNVEFFAGTALLGQASTSPFSIIGSIAAPGTYALTAVATAGGVSGTSSVVSITVVAPLAVSLTMPSAGGGLFSFGYDANPGLSYVVQSSSNLVDWVSVATNTASSSLVPFSEGLTPSPSRYYRVGRLPNP